MDKVTKAMSKEQIAEQYKARDWKNAKTKEKIRALQVAVYVMAGGGLIGRSAAEQPKGFYLDMRLPKRPYSTNQVYQAVRILAHLAEINGMDSNNMPKMMDFPGCGIF